MNDTTTRAQRRAAELKPVDSTPPPEPPPISTCPQCGGVFTPGRASQRFCGAQCRVKWGNNARAPVRHEPRTCVSCGEMFTPGRQDAITCSGKCRVMRSRQGGVKAQGPL